MTVGLLGVMFMALALLVATFAIGLLPLYWLSKRTEYFDNDGPAGNSNDRYLSIFSQFGVGMLLGTSFMLVIPEGINECIEHGGNIGLCLLSGFLVVYLLDRIVQSIMSNKGPSISVEEGSGRADIVFESWMDIVRNPKQACLAILRNNVVFALFIHGLSDGIALGTTVNNNSLLIVMLIAIVIHKIPAVLSLSSLMISKQMLPKWEIISNLFAFAASTPIGYIVLSMFNLKHSDAMGWLSGNLLLMSGGSLLYASFTAFVSDSGAHDHGHSHDYSTLELNPVRTASARSTKDNVENGEEELDIEWDPRRFNLVNENAINGTPSSTPMVPQSDIDGFGSSIMSNHKWDLMNLDDSIYTLAGVVIPIVISYVIGDE